MKIIFGIHAVTAALEHQSDLVLNIYYQDKDLEPRMQVLLKEARNLGIAAHPISKSKLENLAKSKHHQGIVAKIKSQKALDEKAVYEWLKEEHASKPLMLILEGIQDPHNLGACLRSALGLGVDFVILPKNNSAPLNATVSKVSCGADQSLSIVMVGNLARFMNEIKQLGVWVIGTALSSSKPLHQIDLKRACAIVMGTEETGLKQLTQNTCDELGMIPMSESMASLNVSVATGICLYECQRQRQTN